MINLRWHFEPDPNWTLSSGWQYHTGWPATPMELQVDTIPPTEPGGDFRILVTESPGPINSIRLPRYPFGVRAITPSADT